MRFLIALGAVLLAAGCQTPPPQNSALWLSNFAFNKTAVEIVITRNPDCESRGDGFVGAATFMLPRNATQFIPTNGEDVCWRYNRDPDHPGARRWSGWGRADLGTGARVSTNL
jgi:hypothetical protein